MNVVSIRMMTWILPLALLFCGCADISERTQPYLGSPQLAPVSPDNVQIFEKEPQRPIIKLGEINFAFSGNPSRQELEKRLKNAAARLGADGVFIASDQTHITPVAYWDYLGPEPEDVLWRTIVGVAFKYK